MDSREFRGREIAAKCRITKKGRHWLVPSQSGRSVRKYRVRQNQNSQHYTCPDYELRGGKCKHIFAVEFIIRRRHRKKGVDP